METQMESFKKKARLSRRLSSRKGLGSLKTRFKRFLSDHRVNAGETQGSNFASSDSETDERKASSPTPDRSEEIKKSLSSGSSSYSDEGSPSETKDKEKSDSSSDSSEKKRKMEPPKKSSEKRLQLHLQEERQDAFRLPPLEETPPSSPRSNPRFSTGAQSDYGRLLTHTSAPNSPANLSHNFNLNYRGGDSSPVALIHSLSAKESGKHANQLSEISFASPLSSSSLDLDAPGDKVDDFNASSSKTSPSLKPDVLPIVHHDEEQGVWRCGTCGWIYPSPNPSLSNRREHKKYCGEVTNVQRWLGAQDIHDTPDKGASKLEESEVSEESGLQEKLSAADEHPMANSEREDNHEGVPGMSTEPHGAVDQGRLEEIESPNQHAVGGMGNDERNSNAVVDPDEVDDQMKVDKVPEWPTLDTEIKDPSSSGEKLSKKSTSDHGVEDQSKLEDMSNGSTGHHEIEEVSKLEDMSNGSTGHHEIEEVSKLDDLVDRGLDVSHPTRGASNVATEVQNEKEEPVAIEDDGRSAKEMMIEQVDAGQDQRPPKDDNNDKTWVCLDWLSFFIRKDNGETEALSPPSSIYGEQERFRWLPKFYRGWSRTSVSELQQPLLRATGREEEQREVPRRIQEAPLDDDEQVSCFSYLQRFQAQPPALDTNLPEGSDSGLGAASRTELHAFSWGPIPVYTHPPLDMDESLGMEVHKEANALSVPSPSHKVR